MRPFFLIASMALIAAAVAGCLDGTSSPPPPAQTPGRPAAEMLTFLPPVPLDCPERPYPLGDCGRFGEPQLEVQGDGTIWYSAVCCVGQSPPIWRSMDGGLTFEPLPFAQTTAATRDAFGIEGDFAVDDAGNVYFFDISLATTYFTKFAPDGTHVHTKADVFPPLIDRPWVRAGAEDEVFILYNTGVAGSWFYRSMDGGLTWDIAGGTNFPCPLGGLGQGGQRHHLIVTACDTVWQSMDGGLTWDAGTRLDLAQGSVQSGPTPPAFADGAGTVYVPIALAESGQQVLHVMAIDADGSQRGPWPIDEEMALADYPWIAAGAPGKVAVAYYASPNGSRGDQADAQWYLHVAYTLDGGSDHPTWTVVRADDEVLYEGTLGRGLGDFLQLRHAEDGDLVIAYGANDGGGVQNRFVRSQGIDMGHAVFLNGPQ